MEVPLGNLVSGHVVSAPCAENLLLECDERAVVFLPESPRRVQHVDVRLLRRDPLEAMKEIARLEHRRIERFTVEADECAGAHELVGHGREHRALVRVAREQVLPRRERAVLFEPSAADQKRLRAGAAAQSRRFKVEEDERRTRGRAAADERRF